MDTERGTAGSDRQMRFKTLGRGRRKQPGTMNKLEAAYAGMLSVRQSIGEIAWFAYEGMTFKLAPDTRYTPDFAVMLPDGTIELHETKGFMRDDAAVKIKCAAEMFPFSFVLVTKDKSGWNYRRF